MSVLLRAKPAATLRGRGERFIATVALWAGRVRRPALTVAGFIGVTAAAWDVSRPLGLLAFGASCLIIESLTKGDSA